LLIQFLGRAGNKEIRHPFECVQARIKLRADLSAMDTLADRFLSE
jgi:hypothetical protein